jgi:hypothetical protein
VSRIALLGSIAVRIPIHLPVKRATLHCGKVAPARSARKRAAVNAVAAVFEALHKCRRAISSDSVVRSSRDIDRAGFNAAAPAAVKVAATHAERRQEKNPWRA